MCISKINIDVINENNIVAFIKSCKGSMPLSAFGEMRNLGWYLSHSDGEYTDISTSVFLGAEDGVGTSVDVMLTVVWGEQSYYLIFGTNHGDGFNDLSTISFADTGESLISDLGVGIRLDTTGELSSIFESFPDARKKIESNLSRLQSFFHEGAYHKCEIKKSVD
jgi:hypothetical protein